MLFADVSSSFGQFFCMCLCLIGLLSWAAKRHANSELVKTAKGLGQKKAISLLTRLLK